MNTFKKFSEDSRLTAAEITSMDQKLAAVIGSNKTKRSWFRVFAPALVTTIAVAMIVIGGYIFFLNSGHVPEIVNLTAQSVLTQAMASTDNQIAMTGKYKHMIATIYANTDNIISERKFESVDQLGYQYKRYIERDIKTNKIIWDVIYGEKYVLNVAAPTPSMNMDDIVGEDPYVANQFVGVDDGERVVVEFKGDYFVQVAPGYMQNWSSDYLMGLNNRKAAARYLKLNGFRQVTKEELDLIRGWGPDLNGTPATDLKSTEDNLIFALYENIRSGSTNLAKVYQALLNSNDVSYVGDEKVGETKVHTLLYKTNFGGKDYQVKFSLSVENFALLNTKEYAVNKDGSLTLISQYNVDFLEYTDTAPEIK